MQETVGGYAKRSVDKTRVWDWGSKPFVFALAGAGSGNYIDMLSVKIIERVFSHPTCNPSGIIDDVEQLLVDFHKTHVWPRHPESKDVPAVEFLMVLQDKEQAGYPLLFHTHDTAINHIEDYKSIGIGAYLADYIIEKHNARHGKKHPMMALAAYMLKEVRDNIDGCGKDAVIHYFGEEGNDQLFGDYQEFLENQTEKINDVLSDAFLYANALDGADEEYLNENVTKVLRELRDEHEELLEHIKERRRRTEEILGIRKTKEAGAE